MLAMIAADIAAITTLSCRALAVHAAHYGVDVRDPVEHRHALEILSTGLADTPEDKARNLASVALLRNQLIRQKQPWAHLEPHVLAKTIRELARKIGKEITQTQLRRFVTGIGAVVGTGTNVLQINQVCRAGYHLYREHYLEQKYPPDGQPVRRAATMLLA